MAYRPDPSTAGDPLRGADIDALLENSRQFGGAAAAVEHLLHRMNATIDLYKTQIRGLNNDVQEVRAAMSRQGAAPTMAPRDAVRYLSRSELLSIVDDLSRSTLERAAADQKKAEESLRALQTERARMRYAVLDLIERPDMPHGVRDALTAMLAEPGPTAADDTESTSWVNTTSSSENTGSAAGLGDLFGEPPR